MRLIDADKLLEYMGIKHESTESCKGCMFEHDFHLYCKSKYIDLEEVCEAIDSAKTVMYSDEAHWVVHHTARGMPYCCSYCGYEEYHEKTPYCPMCGAKMENGND